MAYIYQADVYCEECGKEIRNNLRSRGEAPEDELDHRSYDSDDYPKDANVEREESDIPQYCAKCGEFFHNPLTSDGYQYVQSALNEIPDAVSIANLIAMKRPHLAEWASWYGFTYWTNEDCREDGRHNEAGWYSDESY